MQETQHVVGAAVLSKPGMIWEGRLRHTMELADGWRDSAVYSVLADEWRPRP